MDNFSHMSVKENLDKIYIFGNKNAYCLHQLVEVQVERTPDTVAVTYKGEQLTYHQLNERANQLAHYLHTVGVGPEVLVGICIERSLEMVIGVLGILKAGGAYVPLDPNQPSQRMTFMLKDARVPILLTRKEQLPSFPEHQALIIYLDINSKELETQGSDNPSWPCSEMNVAYVIYTSGSTGKPKGVVMPHRSLRSLLAWQNNNSALDIGAKTLQFASLSFDVSFQEIFSTLCAGGTLIMITEDLKQDPVQLLQFLKREGISRLFLPFVALQQIAETSENYGIVPTSLREVVTAGEQLQINSYIRNFFKKLGQCILHNQYGPTESHVVTAFRLTSLSDQWPTLPPVGRPIVNTQIYILDSHQQPVPIGTSGELCIAGLCLARGYLNRPELTVEKFIPNPFEGSLGTYIYRTGDLARYLSDGNIEFLGRIDHQVKVRGFRVELGEIEVVLSEYAEVREAVVIARKGDQGENMLLACLIVNQSSSFSIKELHSFLKERLPEYMIPTFFAILDTLPLTLSGKVDRRALSTLTDFISLAETEAYIAPQTTLEEILVNMWVSILRVKQVGIRENFFELGGNSLLATRVMLRVNQLLQIKIPLRVFFDAPTIEELAIVVEQMLIDKLERS